MFGDARKMEKENVKKTSYLVHLSTAADSKKAATDRTVNIQSGRNSPERQKREQNLLKKRNKTAGTHPPEIRFGSLSASITA
ncbi:hypothetical protein ACFS07_17040 [Undibacterium arcticum]